MLIKRQLALCKFVPNSRVWKLSFERFSNYFDDVLGTALHIIQVIFQSSNSHHEKLSTNDTKMTLQLDAFFLD
jgi:hypothetical protein